MAKNKLPSVDDAEPAVEAAIQEIRKPKPDAAAEAPAAAADGYIPRRIDAKLTRAQAKILRDKLRSLQDSGAKTADGRFVTSRTQAVQWILENEVVV